jgi:hypothetical protein
MSVIMSVPNNGLYSGSSVWRCVDERESRVAAPQLAAGGVDYAGAGSMNRVKFNPI